MIKIQNIKQIVLGPRQMTLGFDNDIKKEQDSIISCILEQFENCGQVVLDEFVAHIEQLYGLSNIDTLQYIFWSAHELKIHFRINGKNISPFETKRVLLKSPGEFVEIITNKNVEDSIFQDVKIFYKRLSKKNGQNDFEDQYNFACALLSDLKTWKNDLDSIRSIAQRPFYPGSTKINGHLDLLKTLLARQDSYSLIHSCYKHKEEIFEAACDIKIISNFYTRRIKFWEILIQSIEKFRINLDEIKKNSKIFSDFKRLTQILVSPAPYHLIAEADTLLKRVQDCNDLIIRKKTNARRKEAILKIDAMIKKLVKLFDNDPNTDPDLRNTFLYALRQSKKKLLHTKSIRQIDLLIYDTKDLFDDFIEELMER